MGGRFVGTRAVIQLFAFFEQAVLGRIELARSHTVSDMVQKVGGDSVQPIVHASEMPTRGVSPLCLGSRTANRRQPSGVKYMQ